MNLRNMSKRTGVNRLILILISLLLVVNLAQASNKSSDKTTVESTSVKNKPKTENNEPKTYPIQISADQLISQTKGGQSEYKGNVQLERNKLSMQGSSLKITHPGDKLQQAVMSGSPAKFKDYLIKKQQWLTGEAKQITFQQDKDTVTLSEGASITMDNGNKILADKIIIYNKDETFEAFGGKQTSRVKMTILPDSP